MAHFVHTGLILLKVGQHEKQDLFVQPTHATCPNEELDDLLIIDLQETLFIVDHNQVEVEELSFYVEVFHGS